MPARPARLLAVAALATAALAAPASAKPRAVELTERTTITTTVSAATTVTVPRDATLSPLTDKNPDVTFTGAGRLLGLWLYRLSDDIEDFSGVTALRMPAFAGGGTYVTGTTTPAMTCTPLPNATLPLTYQCDDPKPTAILLRAGTYRLAVLTDGKPVRVSLRLHGLARRAVQVRPATATHAVQADLAARESAGDKMVTYGGTIGTASPYSSVLVVARATSAASGPVHERSLCVRRDGTAPPAWAYAPPCAGGFSSWTEEVHAGDYQTYVGAGGVTLDDGTGAPVTLAAGGSFSDTGGVRLAGAVGAIVPLV